MSWIDGVPATLLYAGPPANYSAADAALATAQSLITPVSGNYSQPSVPYGFWQIGKSGQLLKGRLAGIVTAEASATTMIITVGLNAAANTVSATSILATPALTVTSFASAGWSLDFEVLCRGTGYGTASVSTSLLTEGAYQAGAVGVQTPPASVTTIDASVNQWMWATVTFSTSSATNSCTLEKFTLFGMS